MSAKLQLRSPRSEVSRELPFSVSLTARDRSPSPRVRTPGAERLIEEQLERLKRTGAGQLIDRAALRLLEPDDVAAASPAAGDEADRDIAIPPQGGLEELYELAVDVDRVGRSREAAVLLAALGSSVESRVDGLLGLAVLAVRSGKLDLAYELASSCLDAEPRHPRAYSICGVCELERGNTESAKAYLAAAARSARARPEFREELQIAQRSLLLMHLR